MGIETAVFVMAGVAAAGEAAKMTYEVKAAHAKESALELQGKQLELQTQQKTLENYEVMEKVIDAQIAHMTTTGAAFSSPSYNAIQRNTLNIGARKARNIEIEGELAQQNIEIEKKNVRNSLYAQLFGDVAHIASTAASTAAKFPTLPE